MSDDTITFLALFINVSNSSPCWQVKIKAWDSAIFPFLCPPLVCAGGKRGWSMGKRGSPPLHFLVAPLVDWSMLLLPLLLPELLLLDPPPYVPY